jgi:hypothetical protein
MQPVLQITEGASRWRGKCANCREWIQPGEQIVYHRPTAGHAGVRWIYHHRDCWSTDIPPYNYYLIVNADS